MTPPKGYRCKGCSYKGNQFPQGVCPACGSRNIARLEENENTATERRRWSLWLLAALWGYLAYALFEKLT